YAIARDRIQREEYGGEYKRRAEVLLQIKEQQRDADADQHRQGVLKPRHLHARNDLRENRVLLTQLAQQRPVLREVSGEEEYQQDLDGLHGLQRPQVDACVAARRTAPGHDQRDRQHDRAQQRHEAVARRRRIPIDQTRRQHHQTSGRDTFRERNENQRVPQRIAQPDHQREPEPREHQQQRQECPRTRKPAHRPHDVCQQERRQNCAGPQEEIAAESVDAPDRNLRTDDRELGWREKRDRVALRVLGTFAQFLDVLVPDQFGARDADARQ